MIPKDKAEKFYCKDKRTGVWIKCDLNQLQVGDEVRIVKPDGSMEYGTLLKDVDVCLYFDGEKPRTNSRR